MHRAFRRSALTRGASAWCAVVGEAYSAGSMKYVLVYEASDDFRPKVPLHIEAHRALWTIREWSEVLTP